MVCAYMHTCSTHCVYILQIHACTINICIYRVTVAVASCGVGEHNNLLYEGC